MNTIPALADCALQAILQSLATGAGCFGILIILLRLFPALGDQGRYLLCNAAQLVIALVFLQPFASLLVCGAMTGGLPHSAAGPAPVADIIVAGRQPATAIGPVAPAPGMLSRAAGFLNSHSELIFELYLLGLSVFLLRLAFGYYAAFRLRHKGTTAPDAFWQEQMVRACDKLKPVRSVRLAFSSLVQSPCIIGWARAVVLIPVTLATRLSAEQAEAVLVHELAHHRLLHSYLNLAAQLALSLVFFNPFAWMIHARSSRFREYACDALAVRHSLQIALSESLLVIAANRQPLNPVPLRLFGHNRQLSNRIKNLLQMKTSTSNLRPLILACSMATLVAVGGFQQLRALPRQQAATDTLITISKALRASGSMNFLIVEALHDSLIRYNTPYELKYEAGTLSLNGQQLAEPFQSRYRALLESSPVDKHVSRWTASSDGLAPKTVLNPRSSFRNDAAAGKVAITHTAARPVAPQAAAPQRQIDRLVRSLIVDKLVDTLQPVFLKFDDRVLTINGQTLTANLSAKYEELVLEAAAFSPDVTGNNAMQIYPEGVMPPSSVAGNSKIEFPRQPGDRPYAVQFSERGFEHRTPDFAILRNAVLQDSLAEARYTIHLLYNTEGIFINSRKLPDDAHRKYARLLTDQLKYAPPLRKTGFVDMTL